LFTLLEQFYLQQCYRKVVGGAVVSCEANGVEPVSDETADENNEKVLDNSEEFYEALEQSRWSKVVFSADMHENDLLKALS
uniref:Mlh1_C domain-containing protein n=1 Tax=Gongylonema pulchrum TaxID=637853 RepID=A0A183D8V0_9BILA